MAGHTPGPWIVQGREIYGPPDPQSRHKNGRCLIGGVVDSHTDWRGRAGLRAEIEAGDAEARANARLIAAAPRLLAALEEALRYISLCEIDEVVPTTTGIGYGEAEAAVAAATMEGHA